MVFGLLTGALFGFLFYKVGAVRYSRIVGMCALTDNKIMKFAFTTIAFSSFIYGLAAIFNLAEPLNLTPRIMPYLGASAHILGGVIFGAALATIGFCPGACVARVGTNAGPNKFAPYFGIIGLFFGVFLYGLLKQPLISAGILLERPVPMTLHGFLGIAYGPLVIILGALFLFLALLADRLGHEVKYDSGATNATRLSYFRGEWHWLPSGMLGGFIVVLASAQGGYLGFSGSALAALAWIGKFVGIPNSLVPMVNDGIIWRAGLLFGLIPGAMLAQLISISSKGYLAHAAPKQTFRPAALISTFAGGTAVAFGAMLGGGCTTGALMAAFPTLSIGSFAMAITFFTVSKVTGVLLHKRNGMQVIHEIEMAGDKIYN